MLNNSPFGVEPGATLSPVRIITGFGYYPQEEPASLRVHITDIPAVDPTTEVLFAILNPTMYAGLSRKTLLELGFKEVLEWTNPIHQFHKLHMFVANLKDVQEVMRKEKDMEVQLSKAQAEQASLPL